MTTTDHPQDHIRIARDCLGMADKKPKKHLRSLAWSLAAQANATLAVAHELRTANLVAALSAGYLLGHDHEDEAWDIEIRTRLGLNGGAE